ncbi:hypothetical protein [Luteipulveratus mongoliensis]|uniref:DUF732 domain-containing protein n=1 Tax=Luteipulveratus mongoliensis TaxID=571913 RepID=A0A0K1JHQ7_9MICO|nr:hypothetical protein [Luteipulveratus mongoliensis]AKU16130.1 hypothetical protein VV02_10090 [Luteipulveratus mongoliensis]
MIRTSKLRLTACGLLLAAPLALTACGSDKSDSPAGGDKTSSQGGAPGIASGEPNPGATDGGGDNAGKPSKDEVSAGLKKFYDKDTTISKVADTKKLSDCVVDKAYDNVSAKTLNAMKDGEPKNMDPADSQKFANYGAECAKTAAKVPGAGGIPSIPGT